MEPLKRDRPTLKVTQGVLHYRSPEGILRWSAPVDNIIVIAEYTTDEGPYVDDYFLVFVTIEKGKQYFATATFYSEGTEDVIRELSERWKTDIELRLVNSTDWKSRIAWPAALAGREYFEFAEVQPNGLAEKLRKAVLGPVYEYFPSKAVRALLDSL